MTDDVVNGPEGVLDGLPVHVGPSELGDVAQELTRLGARIVGPADAEVLIWTSMSRLRLVETMHPGIRFVQLPIAGVERWVEDAELMAIATFASAAGIYGELVAEHALALLLACARDLHRFARLGAWEEGAGLRSGVLRGAHVAVVGTGGIGTALIRLLVPLGVTTVAVSRSGRYVPGAVMSVASSDVDGVWPTVDAVVLAAPSTPATEGLVDARVLARMRDDAWLVNVARGPLVDTAALVDALRERRIGGAALDVTDPEPLPEGHPLWNDPRCLITPHTGLPERARVRLLSEHAVANTVRYAQGLALRSVIDPLRGY